MKRNRLLSLLFSLAILGGVCLGAGLLGWGAWNLPAWAASQFGLASPALEPTQRIYLSARLLMQSNDLLQPTDPDAQPRPFQVALGESPTEITNRLEREGLIHSARALRDYLVYAGLDTSLQAGEYQLSPAASPLAIALQLQDATPSQVTFNILPGWRMEEIAAALPTSGLEFSAAELLNAASLPGDIATSDASPVLSSLLAELPAGASLEGFLFPDSYTVNRTINTQEFVAELVENFSNQLGAELRQGFERQGLSLFEAVSLASIVQREAIVEEEMPMIASVFLNRLQAGMKLDADPTVQYAVGFNAGQNTWWTVPLSAADLAISSPYNTYQNLGLPPGPIANPGLKALQAVALPAQTPYYYFRAACDGSGRHIFAETYEQHLQNACP
jgi:UPF0755 protein